MIYNFWMDTSEIFIVTINLVSLNIYFKKETLKLFDFTRIGNELQTGVSYNKSRVPSSSLSLF